MACLLTLAGAVLVLLTAAVAAGGQVGPAARACALVALAGVVALLAARGWSRLAVGLVLTVAGLAIAGAAVSRLGGAAGLPGVIWPVVTGTGGLLVSAGGLLAAARGRSWPTLGARYDASATRPVAAADAWDALDRGEDPTER